LSRETTQLNIVSSTTETNIFNFTIPANTMQTDRMVRLTIFADRLNNSGAAETAPTFRVYTGGTLRYADASVALANNANRTPIVITVMCAMCGTNSLMSLRGVVLDGTQGGATTGIGNLATDEITSTTPFGPALGGTYTNNTAVDWDLRVTWQNGTNNANVSFRRQYAILELL
jgi:hypothetical protein